MDIPEAKLKLKSLFNLDESNRFFNIELKLAEHLDRIAEQGLKVDVKKLDDTISRLQRKLIAQQLLISSKVKHPIQVGSQKQLSAYLFDERGFESVFSTPNGKRSCADAAIEKFSSDPVVAMIKDWKTKRATLGYLLGIKNFLKGDRVQTHFVHWKAITGRIYCQDYNIQQLPPEGRACIIPDEGKVFLNVDYSAIEMRLLFSIAQQTDMFDPILDKLDIHSLTYSRMKNKPYEEVTDEERRTGKILNFGICYGTSPYSLSNRLSITPLEAKELILDYFRTYDKVSAWMTTVRRFAKQHNYIENYFGYRRDLTKDFEQDYRTAYRMAVNGHIQSTAACILKLALEKLIDLNCKDISLTPAILHDSVLLSVNKGMDSVFRSKIEEIVRDCMEFQFPDWIRLEVDMQWSDKNWEEAAK